MLPIRDIMTTEVISVSPDTSLLNAVQMFADSQITGAPVVEGSRVVGVLSATDLMEFSGASADAEGRAVVGLEPSDGARRDEMELEDESAPPLGTDFFGVPPMAFIDEPPSPDGALGANLAGHDVSELMTRKIWSVGPYDDVSVAAKLMKRAGIHRVLVMERGKLLGIVTTMDIARAVADGRVTKHVYVFNHEAEFEER